MKCRECEQMRNCRFMRFVLFSKPYSKAVHPVSFSTTVQQNNTPHILEIAYLLLLIWLCSPCVQFSIMYFDISSICVSLNPACNAWSLCHNRLCQHQVEVNRNESIFSSIPLHTRLVLLRFLSFILVDSLHKMHKTLHGKLNCKETL